MWFTTELTIFALLQLSIVVSTYEEVWIKAGQTSWGDWGPPSLCPEDHFVNALIIKAAAPGGYFYDDSGMSGAMLHCTELAYPSDAQLSEVAVNLWPIQKNLTPSAFIFSAEGVQGNWHTWRNCPSGIAIGFDLKSEPDQGSWDDVAATDMTLVCIDWRGSKSKTAAGPWGKWGTWSGDKTCPQGMAVCGIQTQVEKYLGDAGDDSALNQVALKCCDLPRPGQLCEPTDKFEDVVTYGSFGSNLDVKYTVNLEVGVGLKNTKPSVASLVEGIALHENPEELLSDLSYTFQDKLSYGAATGYSYDHTDKHWRLVQGIEPIEMVVRKGCIATLEQVVGECGGFKLKTKKLRRQDQCKGETGKLKSSENTFFAPI